MLVLSLVLITSGFVLTMFSFLNVEASVKEAPIGYAWTVAESTLGNYNAVEGVFEWNFSEGCPYMGNKTINKPLTDSISYVLPGFRFGVGVTGERFQDIRIDATYGTSENYGYWGTSGVIDYSAKNINAKYAIKVRALSLNITVSNNNQTNVYRLVMAPMIHTFIYRENETGWYILFHEIGFIIMVLPSTPLLSIFFYQCDERGISSPKNINIKLTQNQTSTLTVSAYYDYEITYASIKKYIIRNFYNMSILKFTPINSTCIISNITISSFYSYNYVITDIYLEIPWPFITMASMGLILLTIYTTTTIREMKQKPNIPENK
ncbi:MAG: hypothetical protein ACP6IU_15310 [Candidatus Asgardarchaeia archaeon]